MTRQQNTNFETPISKFERHHVAQGMKRIMLLTIAALLCVAFTTIAETAVVVDSVKGKAEVQRAGRQLWQPAAKKMKLYNNDVLRVLSQGYVSLTWPDGSTSYVHQNSQILINLVQNEGAQGSIINHATIFFGAVFFLVKKIAPRGIFDDSSMRIYTPTAVLAIRGTAFEVGVDDKIGTTRIKVVSGTVQVRNILKNVSLFLGAPYQTTVTMNGDPAEPSAVVQSDIDSLKSWIPGTIITAAMEKQIAQSKKDYYTLTGKLQDKCFITLFTNVSSYHGPWPIAAEITKIFNERLTRTMPKLKFTEKDSLAGDPFEAARADSARFLVLGSIEVFDVTQHAEISARADEYREYADASVQLRLRLLDAASGKQLAEEVYSGEVTNMNAKENSWQTINKLKFDLNDKAFANSIIGIALAKALDQAAEKMTRYLE